MVVLKRCGLLFLLAGFLLSLGACAEPVRPVVSGVPETRLPRKVAILPFVNHSTDEQGAVILRKMFHNFFSSLNYTDMEQFQIDNRLKHEGVYEDIVKGKDIPASRICRILGVDALVFGEVTDFGKLYAVLYSEVRASLKTKMVAGDSGRVIWHYEHTARISEGGISLNLLGLASTAAKTLLNLRQTASMRVAADLSREMVATIPNPPGRETPGPKIKVLVHNGAHRLLTPGQKLNVVMVGDKGEKASWGIYPGIKDLKMKEKEPGVYAGSYTVKPRDRILAGQITGYLSDPKKGQSRWLDVLGPVTLATPTILPARVKGQLRLNRKKSPYLIKDTLIVGPGDGLQLGPGTEIWVQGLGIVIRGSLTVKGTAADPITIQGRSASRWKGLFLDAPAGKTKMDYLNLRDARRGLTAKHATLFLNHCRFSGNGWALALDSSQAEISSCVIRQSEKAGISIRKTRLVMENSEVVENAFYGLLIEASKADIHHCNILNNGRWNLKVIDASSRVDARHNRWGTTSHDRKEMKITGPALTD